LQSQPKRKIVFNPESIRDQRFKKNKKRNTQTRYSMTQKLNNENGFTSYAEA
jgi:hypothetical protein